MQTLTFQNITLAPAKIDSQIWLSSADLAKALGYAETDSVTKIYNRNKDEFTSNMTMTVKLTANGINGSTRQKETRIFSLRGCHLIAMFARTAVAKQFRQWVLDILDKEVGQPVVVHTTTDDRHPLTQAVKLLARTKGLSYSDAWKLVHQRFGVDNVKKLTLDQLEQAVCYVHSLLMIQNIANPEQLYDTLANSACHLRDYARMLKILKHLPMTDDNAGGNIYRQITETFDDIVRLSHTMNLRNHAGRPMFEQNRINYYRGNALVW